MFLHTHAMHHTAGTPVDEKTTHPMHQKQNPLTASPSSTFKLVLSIPTLPMFTEPWMSTALDLYPWLKEGATGNPADLVQGGYYMGADYVKHTMPLATNMAMLAWSLMEFAPGIEQVNVTCVVSCVITMLYLDGGRCCVSKHQQLQCQQERVLTAGHVHTALLQSAINSALFSPFVFLHIGRSAGFVYLCKQYLCCCLWV